MGVAVLVMVISAAPVTLVVAEPLSLPLTGSVSSLVTAAEFAIALSGPDVGVAGSTVAPNSMATCWPTVRSPTLQEMSWPPTTVQPAGKGATGVRNGGRSSAIVVSRAIDGPLLRTVMTYVTSSPATTGSGVTVLETSSTSADVVMATSASSPGGDTSGVTLSALAKLVSVVPLAIAGSMSTA